MGSNSLNFPMPDSYALETLFPNSPVFPKKSFVPCATTLKLEGGGVKVEPIP